MPTCKPHISGEKDLLRPSTYDLLYDLLERSMKVKGAKEGARIGKTSSQKEVINRQCFITTRSCLVEELVMQDSLCASVVIL